MVLEQLNRNGSLQSCQPIELSGVIPGKLALDFIRDTFELFFDDAPGMGPRRTTVGIITGPKVIARHSENLGPEHADAVLLKSDINLAPDAFARQGIHRTMRRRLWSSNLGQRDGFWKIRRTHLALEAMTGFARDRSPKFTHVI